MPPRGSSPGTASEVLRSRRSPRKRGTRTAPSTRTSRASSICSSSWSRSASTPASPGSTQPPTQSSATAPNPPKPPAGSWPCSTRNATPCCCWSISGTRQCATPWQRSGSPNGTTGSGASSGASSKASSATSGPSWSSLGTKSRPRSSPCSTVSPSNVSPSPTRRPTTCSPMPSPPSCAAPPTNLPETGLPEGGVWPQPIAVDKEVGTKPIDDPEGGSAMRRPRPAGLGRTLIVFAARAAAIGRRRLGHRPGEQRRQLAATRHAQLGVDAVQVGLHGAAGDRQPGGDLDVGETTRREAGDLPFTGRQPVADRAPQQLGRGAVAPLHELLSAGPQSGGRRRQPLGGRHRGCRGGQLGGVQEAAQLLQAAADRLQPAAVALGQRLDGGDEGRQQPPLGGRHLAEQLGGRRRRAVTGRLVEGEDRVGEMARADRLPGRAEGESPGIGDVARRRFDAGREEPVL